MEQTRRSFLVTGATVASGVALAGCSGDDDDSDSAEANVDEEGSSNGGGGSDGGDSGSDGDSDGGGEGGSDGGNVSDDSSDGDGAGGGSDGGNESSGNDGSDSGGSSDLEILDHELYEDDFSAGVEGTVRNNSDEEMSYVEVQAVFLDEEGTQIGDSIDNVNDLAADREWEFDCMFLGDDPGRIDSYEIEASTGF